METCRWHDEMKHHRNHLTWDETQHFGFMFYSLHLVEAEWHSLPTRYYMRQTIAQAVFFYIGHMVGTFITLFIPNWYKNKTFLYAYRSEGY